jgi:hypothetical protein
MFQAMSCDTSVATAGLKVCCACGADVNGQARMKDSKGRYWCVPCGEADQRKKQITSTTAPCHGCHKTFPKGKLDPHAGAFYCKACLKKFKSGKGVPAVHDSSSATGTWHMGPGIAAGHANAEQPVQSAVAEAMAAVKAKSSAKASAGPDRKRLVIMASVLVMLVLLALVMNFVLSD